MFNLNVVMRKIAVQFDINKLSLRQLFKDIYDAEIHDLHLFSYSTEHYLLKYRRKVE